MQKLQSDEKTGYHFTNSNAYSFWTSAEHFCPEELGVREKEGTESTRKKVRGEEKLLSLVEQAKKKKGKANTSCNSHKRKKGREKRGKEGMK